MTGRSPPREGLPRLVAVTAGFARMGFMRGLQNRSRYLVGVVSYLVYVAFYSSLWRAVYHGRAEISGFSETDMVTYVAVGWLSRSFYFTAVDLQITQKVRSGAIASDLLRPVGFGVASIAEALGESLFRGAFVSVPSAVVIALAYPVSAPAGGVHAALFAASLGLGFFINAQVSYLAGLAAFPLKEVSGVITIKRTAVDLLSGLLVPPAFFPEAIRGLLGILPFQGIAYLPLALYLGRIRGAEAVGALGFQAAWAAALALAGALAWRAASARLTIQGG